MNVSRRLYLGVAVLASGVTLAAALLMGSNSDQEGGAMRGRGIAEAAESAGHEGPAPSPGDRMQASRTTLASTSAEDLQHADTASGISETEVVWPWSRVEVRLRGDMSLSDEHADRVRAGIVKWPQDLSAENSIEHLSREIGPLEVQELKAEVLPFNADLELIADRYVKELRDIKESVWAHQTYEVSQVSGEEPIGDLPPGSSVHNYPGWRISYRVSAKEHPQLGDLQRRARELRHQREVKVQDVMRSFESR